MFDYFLNGIVASFSPVTFLTMLMGVVGGIVIGCLPGMTGSMGLVLMMPLLYYLQPSDALLTLAGIMCGSMYGGSISAILISTPGTPSAAATMLDGYPLTRQGKAGKALGIAVVSSAAGGIFSSLALLLIAPALAEVAMSFHAHEYFSLSIFGLTIMAGASGKNLVKGLAAGWTGLFLSTVGVDGNMGLSRFTFDIPNLMGGINILPVLIGVFALSQIFENGEAIQKPHEIIDQDLRDVWPTFADMKRIALSLAIGCVVGTFIGIIPGTGGAIACFLSYDLARKLHRNGDKFGTGLIEGIAAPESSNNATTGGALVPMLTLGIPGDVMTAVMLGALMLIGVRPGPLLFTEQPEAVYTLLAGMFVIQFVILAIGMGACRVSPLLLRVPPALLNPAIVVFSVVGSYTLGNNLFDVWLTFFFGIAGYFMRKFDFPGAPMVLGLILGPMAEDHLNRALLVSRNDWSTFVTRPISGFFIGLSVLSIAFSFLAYGKGKSKSASGGGKSAA
ncbi:MAG: tripartite tricarboxylate transporter permease [Planctomycetota bacterium]|jgi:putative tricarboxylic transport membrane protein|nr:tripartite tricarboxylate transporter permease [Planctomycetota bacterium]